jgi:hypothetical protein
MRRFVSGNQSQAANFANIITTPWKGAMPHVLARGFDTWSASEISWLVLNTAPASVQWRWSGYQHGPDWRPQTVCGRYYHSASTIDCIYRLIIQGTFPSPTKIDHCWSNDAKHKFCASYPHLLLPFSYWAQLVEALREKWGGTNFPSLQELAFDCPSEGESHEKWRFDLPRQHQAIAFNLAQALPSLYRISFMEEVCWEKEGGGATLWRPLIRSQFHQRVKSIVEGGTKHVLDFEGVIASLYEEEEMNGGIRRRLGLLVSETV